MNYIELLAAPHPCTEILSVFKWTLSLDTKSVIFETAIEWHKTCDRYLFFSKNNTHILLQMSEQAYNNQK